MNARLRKSLVWYSAIVYRGGFSVNHYEADIDLVTVSTDHEEQNIAYERMKFWVEHILNHSILIGSDDPAMASYRSLDARLIVLPEEPVDQSVGIMLYLKLNSIMENRLVVTDVSVRSTQGDDMSYLHNYNESVGDKFSVGGWWADPRPVYSGLKPKSDNNVVELDRAPEWKDYGLEWDTNTEPGDKKVVFAKFDRNGDE